MLENTRYMAIYTKQILPENKRINPPLGGQGGRNEREVGGLIT